MEVQQAQHEKNADLLRKTKNWKARIEREIGFYIYLLYVAEPGKALQSIAYAEVFKVTLLCCCEETVSSEEPALS